MNDTKFKATIELIRGSDVMPKPIQKDYLAKAWHTANCAFSERERAAFNQMHYELNETSRQLLDEVGMMPDGVDTKYLHLRAKKLMDMIHAIPFLYD